MLAPGDRFWTWPPRSRFSATAAEGSVLLGPGNRNAIDALIACHSAVFDLTARNAYVAAAPHTLGRYVCFDLDLLASAGPGTPLIRARAAGIAPIRISRPADTLAPSTPAA